MFNPSGAAQRHQGHSVFCRAVHVRTLCSHRASALQVLLALGTEGSRQSQAAQCVSQIAIAELPKRLWSGVISEVVARVQPDQTPLMKVAALQTLGYICEEVVRRAVHALSCRARAHPCPEWRGRSRRSMSRTSTQF